MKFINKLLLTLILLICGVSIFTAASCTDKDSRNFGGIVDNFEYIGDTGEHIISIQLEITFCNKSDTFYPYVIIIEPFYEKYSCLSDIELFENDDFIKDCSRAVILEVKNGKSIITINKKFEANVSIYFYENINNNPGLIQINNLSNYIGFLNYKAPSNNVEELSPQVKGLIKLFGSKVELNQLNTDKRDFELYRINSLFKVNELENNYVVDVTGKKGYDNGTITCLVAFVVENNVITELRGVAITDWENQAYIEEISQQFLKKFSENFKQNIYYSTDNGFLATSATKSSNAVCNAVNGAIECIQKELYDNKLIFKCHKRRISVTYG